MKRLIALALSVCMLAFCVACGAANKKQSFDAKVLEINGSSVTVRPLGDNTASGDRVSFSVAELDDIGAEVGCTVKVYYKGAAQESYPEQIQVNKWEFVQAATNLGNFDGEWLNRQTAIKMASFLNGVELKITEIYADCFFATSVADSPNTYKINYALEINWCVGDQLNVEYKNAYYDEKSHRLEADGISVTESDFEPEEGVEYNPLI